MNPIIRGKNVTVSMCARRCARRGRAERCHQGNLLVLACLRARAPQDAIWEWASHLPHHTSTHQPLSLQRQAYVSTKRRSSCLPRSKSSVKPARRLAGSAEVIGSIACLLGEAWQKNLAMCQGKLVSGSAGSRSSDGWQCWKRKHTHAERDSTWKRHRGAIRRVSNQSLLTIFAPDK